MDLLWSKSLELGRLVAGKVKAGKHESHHRIQSRQLINISHASSLVLFFLTL